MAKQFSVHDDVYAKLEILRATKSKNLSFSTLMEVMTDRFLENASDSEINNRLALQISGELVYRAFRYGLVREIDDQVVSAIRFLLLGRYGPTITIIQGLQNPVKEE